MHGGSMKCRIPEEFRNDNSHLLMILLENHFVKEKIRKKWEWESCCGILLLTGREREKYHRI